MNTTENQGEHTHKQTRGWFLPYLLAIDETPGVGHGRWDYWMKICFDLELPNEPIPHIDFQQPYQDTPYTPAHELLPEHPFRHVKRVLDPYIQKGEGWYDDAWLMFVRWLLHGFGRRGLAEEVERIPASIRDHWYTQFNLGYLVTMPIDWSAFILQGGPRWMGKGGGKWSKTTAFFSTPMNVCKLMTDMTFITEDRDTRLLTVCDPCCGTGSMLLPASNYSLRLYGTDIVYDLVLCTELNGYLWAPWMVCMPPGVDELFTALTGEYMPARPVQLETDPIRVEVTQAYREGKIGQADFLAALNVQTAAPKPKARPVEVKKEPEPATVDQLGLF